MSRIVLLGMKGVGKTTVGRRLAREMNVPFVDTDWELERRWGKGVRQMFSEVGERVFREREREVLSEIRGNGVIAVGGGSSLSEENREILRKLGVLVCLHMDKEDLLERWKGVPLVCRDFDQYYKERMESLCELSCLWVDARKDVVPLLLKVYGE